MRRSDGKRDGRITREIHRIFWRANLSNPPTFIAWVFTRPPAVFVYNILIPIQIAYALQAIINRQFDSIGHYALVIMVLAVVYCILWAVGGLVICRNGELAAQYVQRTIFTNYLNKDYEFYNSTYLGALGAQATRLRDAFSEYNAVVLNAAAGQGIVVVFSIAIIAYHSWQLAAVTLICMALVLSFTIASGRWRLRYRRKLSESSSELAGVIGDALGQGATVKSFAAEEYEQRRLNDSLVPWARRQYWSWMTSIPSDVGRMLLAAGAVGVLLILTARLYQEGSISIAIVALVQLYVVKLITTTYDIAETIKAYEGAMGGSYQAVKTMLVEPTIVDQPTTIKLSKDAKPSIDLQDVTFSYGRAKNAHQVVKKFSLEIKPGEKIGLVGYSGAGKTTLTKLLVRFMDINKGLINIAGVDIRTLAQQDLRRYVSYVPQEPLLFHRSIIENIAYGQPSADRREVLKAAKVAYVDEFVRNLPEGYDTLVGERGVKLSGGQRQRVAIARALLKGAPILVLDEATSALDSRSEQFIQKALWALMEDRTALVVAHRLSTIQRMDRIAVMDKGQLVQLGTHDQLLKDKKGIYARLWSQQSGGYVGVADNQEVDTGVTE